MTPRWAIRFAAEGDYRFASHHDTLRLMQRAAHRARLPLAYTQGFNPRCKLSLAMPRPVGVASRADLLVLTLADEGDLTGEQIVARLNRQFPTGLHACTAEQIPPKYSPQPIRADYVLDLDPLRYRQASRRVAELTDTQEWIVERPGKARRGRAAKPRPLDLKPMVQRIEARQGRIEIALIGRQGRWARPAEMMTLLGLDGRRDLARLVRTDVQYTWPDRPDSSAQDRSAESASGP